jgi:hypothetical protein
MSEAKKGKEGNKRKSTQQSTQNQNKKQTPNKDSPPVSNRTRTGNNGGALAKGQTAYRQTQPGAFATPSPVPKTKAKSLFNEEAKKQKEKKEADEAKVAEEEKKAQEEQEQEQKRQEEQDAKEKAQEEKQKRIQKAKAATKARKDKIEQDRYDDDQRAAEARDKQDEEAAIKRNQQTKELEEKLKSMEQATRNRIANMEKEQKEKQQQIWEDIQENNRRQQELADSGEDEEWEEEEEEQRDYKNDSTRGEEDEEERAKENKDYQKQRQEWDKRGNNEDDLRKKQMQLLNMQIKAAEDRAEAAAKKAKEKTYTKMGKHLQLSKADSKHLGKVAAHLKLLSEENEDNRVNFLREGAGALTLPGGYEKMTWKDLVKGVLKMIKSDYMNDLYTLISTPSMKKDITDESLVDLRHDCRTAVESFQWLLIITESKSNYGDSERLIRDMILKSLPKRIRDKVDLQSAGHTEEDNIDAVIRAVVKADANEETKTNQRYPYSGNKQQQHMAPVQTGVTRDDLKKMLEEQRKVITKEFQNLAPAQEWAPKEEKEWKSTEENGAEAVCYNCNKKGHISYECPDRNDDDVTCYACQQKGHYSYDCPENNGKGGKGKGGKGKGGKGGKGKGGKGEKGGKGGKGDRGGKGDLNKTSVPPQLYEKKEEKATNADSTWKTYECRRCPGQVHSLINCPQYKGCGKCGEKDHTDWKCQKN